MAREGERDPLLVRVGLRYLRGFAGGKRPHAADAIHVLNPDERAALRTIERGAILRAAIAGAVSTIAGGSVELYIARPFLGPRPRYATLGDEVRFYAIVVAGTITAAVIEVLYMYWNSLRSVHQLSHAAGLDLFPDEDDQKAVARAMARAALELPSPTVNLFGVNPKRESSRVRLVVASIAYKAKVSLSSFLAKALVRRVLGRAFVRSWLPFVGVPITAAWNAIVCWLIMREARIRAMGPSAAREMIDLALDAHGDVLTGPLKSCLLRAIASSIVRTEELHPNLVALFREVASRLEVASTRGERLVADDGGDLDNTRAFLLRLKDLEPADQTTVLRVLAIASIIDGRFTRAERRLLVEARTTCGRGRDLSSVERLRVAFIAGDVVERAVVIGVA